MEGETSAAIAAVPHASAARSVMAAIMTGSMPHGSPASCAARAVNEPMIRARTRPG